VKTLFHASVAYAFCACAAGCAGTGASSVSTISAINTRDAVTIGKSTKADVIAVLGKTTVVSFDSGFEVWVYQFKGDTPAMAGLLERFRPTASERNGMPGKNEFVVLFAPSGIVAKTRIRPAPTPGESNRT
jgi:hypothetical protein